MPYMTLQNILDLTREILQDKKKPFLWDDSELVAYYNAYMEEVARETNVWQESKALGTITDDDISFASTTKTITTVSNNFVALGFMAGQTITVSGAASAENNGSKTGTEVTATTIKVSQSLTTEVAGAAVTIVTNRGPSRIVLAANIMDYALDPRIYCIQEDSVFLESDEVSLSHVNRNTLDVCLGDWRTANAGTPTHWMTDYQEGYFTIYPPSDAADAVRFTSTRYPLTELSVSLLSNYPELPRQFHLGIVDGICKLAYKKADSETYDEKRMAWYAGFAVQHMEDIKDYVKKSRQPYPNLIFHRGALP